jgi:hypothetical protein
MAILLYSMFSSFYGPTGGGGEELLEVALAGIVAEAGTTVLVAICWSGGHYRARRERWTIVSSRRLIDMIC